MVQVIHFLLHEYIITYLSYYSLVTRIYIVQDEKYRCGSSMGFRSHFEYRVSRDEVPRVGLRGRPGRVLLGRKRQVQPLLSRRHPGFLRDRTTRLRRNRLVSLPLLLDLLSSFIGLLSLFVCLLSLFLGLLSSFLGLLS